MGFIRILIGIVSVYVFTLIGYNKSKNYKEKVKFFSSLILFCDKFLVELEYKKSSIKKLLSESYYSNDVKMLFNSFLSDKNNLTFPSYLSEIEKGVLLDFLSKLGLGDTESQKIYIKSFKIAFEKSQEESALNFKKYSNLYLKIGFMFGLSLMIIVI